MKRRNFLSQLTRGSALAGLLHAARSQGAEPSAAEISTPRLSPLKITKVRAILTAPARIRLCVIKVETSEPGLYGVGCATFTQRIRTVVTAANEYLAPFLVGKDPDNIEDIWQSMYQSSYWRNGPVLMNALSGVDAALWDIKAKRAGMPLYQLLGGKCRVAVPVYRHAAGATHEAVLERARQFIADGARYIRIQVGVPGQALYGAGSNPTGAQTNAPASTLPKEGHFAGDMFEPAAYRRTVARLFKFMRENLGEEIELLHDMHERLNPMDAINVCKEVEQYHPFFMEDPFSPEDVGYFKLLRQQCATPVSMGELFNNPNEYVDIIKDRLIDYIRCHLSQVGGISMARKIAALCEFFRVRTAWHGPGDTSPVGHAAHVHLDLATTNFGIQEFGGFNDASKEVFPGCPELKNGMLWCNEKPGLGIDINEELAAKYPIRDNPPFDLNWGRLRDRDGTIRRP
jgi:mannonate dehydratase